MCPCWFMTSNTIHSAHSIYKEFALMKPTSIFIKTSRGPVFYEQALIDALNSGQISRAALDVYENEPEVSKQLVGSDRVLLLPHVSIAHHRLKETWLTIRPWQIGPFNETMMKAQQHEMMANLDSWFKTGKAVTPVNGPFEEV